MRPTYFYTGYPGFIGRRLVQFAVEQAPDAGHVVLVEPRFKTQAKRALEQTGLRQVELITGDVSQVHLGLGGPEYRELVKRLTHVFHLAAVSSLGTPLELARRVNVEGTRNVLELCRDAPKLVRLMHFSTCYVSGDRLGVIAEDELEMSQGFRTSYEQSKYEGERLVRAAQRQLPATVIRPATVVGDSQTGEIDRFDGPYYLGMLLVLSPLVLPLPLPGNGVAPLNVVPVDFVVKASWALTHQPNATGKTLHLVDPSPMSARRAYEHIAKRADKQLPAINLPAKATEWVLKLPGLERLARGQRTAIAYVNHLALYSCPTALELLAPTGLRCPPLNTYLDTLVDYALSAWRDRRNTTDESDDPLDKPVG